MNCPRCDRELDLRPPGEPTAEVVKEADGVYILCPTEGCGGKLKT